jgi:hypothetical protein
MDDGGLLTYCKHIMNPFVERQSAIGIDDEDLTNTDTNAERIKPPRATLNLLGQEVAILHVCHHKHTMTNDQYGRQHLVFAHHH